MSSLTIPGQPPGSGASGAPAGSTAGKLVRTTRTAGTLTLNSTAWADVDNTLDLVLEAAAGEWIEVGISARWANEAPFGVLDAATIVAGSPVNHISGNSSGTSQGVQGWLGEGGSYSKAGAVVPYLVQAGDIDGGTVRIRLRYRTLTAANKGLYGGTDNRLIFWGKVLG